MNDVLAKADKEKTTNWERFHPMDAHGRALVALQQPFGNGIEARKVIGG